MSDVDSIIVRDLREYLNTSLSRIPRPATYELLPAPSLDDFGGDKLLQHAKVISGVYDCKYALECAAKEVLYDIVKDTTTSVRLFSTLYDFFDLVLTLSELGFLTVSPFTGKRYKDICDHQLPFLIIEETIDTQPIDGCKQVFSYLESRIDRLAIGVDGTKGKGIILLRLCNELLRRLSKSEDTVFCGRIFVFLTKSFPLSERSGVNLRGEFHVENRTVFDTLEPRLYPVKPALEASAEVSESIVTVTDADAMDVSPLEVTNALDAASELYTVLWSTQHDFAEPVRLFQKHYLDEFKNALDTILKSFKNAIDEHGHNVSSIASEIRRSNKRKRDDMEEHDDLDNYNPKYLTSRELFNLEVRDLVFRRHILVQFLIAIEFLHTLASKQKKYLEADAKNRSVQFAFTLSDEDEKWAETAKKEIVNTLNYRSGMDGLLFSRTVDSVLTREKNWVKWKADNCISFEMPPIAADALSRSRGSCRENTVLPRNPEKGMGTPALGRVWLDDVPDTASMRTLKSAQRVDLPDLKTYNKMIEGFALDKDFASNDEEKLQLDESIANNSWRALRVASKDRFQVFNRLDDELSIRSLVTADEVPVGEKKEMGQEIRKDEGNAI